MTGRQTLSNTNSRAAFVSYFYFKVLKGIEWGVYVYVCVCVYHPRGTGGRGLRTGGGGHARLVRQGEREPFAYMPPFKVISCISQVCV